MHRALPSVSKILQKRWLEQEQALHKKNLVRIKSSVDSKCPISFGNVRRKTKKDQLLEDRFTEIERENRILLEKMSYIMRSRSTVPKPVQLKRKRSLNKEARKRQLIQITMENQALLKRLQQRKPNYNAEKWMSDRKTAEQRLKYLCEFPYKLSNDQRSVSVTRERSRQSNKKLRRLNPMTIIKEMQIGDKKFSVEIQRNMSVVSIIAFDKEQPNSYQLSIPEDQAIELMNGADNYNALVPLLDFDGEKLFLKEKYKQGAVRQAEQNQQMIVGSTTNNSSWKNRAESLDELATKKVEDNFISSDYNDSFDSEDQESKMEESFRELNNKESPVTQIDLFDGSIEESIGI